MLEEFRALVREGLLQVNENQVLPVERPERRTLADEEVRLFSQRVSERLERARAAEEPPAPKAEASGEAAVPVRQTYAQREYLASLRQEVVERIAQRILEAWQQDPTQRSSLREQVIEQLAEDVLQSLERNVR